MTLVAANAPYIRKKVSVKRMMFDVILALIPVTVFACIQNGWNGTYVVLLSVLTMVLTEVLFVAFTHRKKKESGEIIFFRLFQKTHRKEMASHIHINHILIPTISGLIFALTLPAGTAPYVIIVSGFFGLFVGKLLFGGSNIVNPAAFSRIFAGLCFVLTYQQGGIDLISGGTPLTPIQGMEAWREFDKVLLNVPLWKMFVGLIPGSMGEVSGLCILIGGAYLWIRRSADFRASLGMLVTFTAGMLLTGLLKSNQPLQFTLYQILAGGFLFGLVFMVTDPVTSPINRYGQYLFGGIIGILVVFIRLFGSMPEGVVFAIVLMNFLVPTIDALFRKNSKVLWKILSICCIMVIYLGVLALALRG